MSMVGGGEGAAGGRRVVQGEHPVVDGFGAPTDEVVVLEVSPTVVVTESGGAVDWVVVVVPVVVVHAPITNAITTTDTVEEPTSIPTSGRDSVTRHLPAPPDRPT